MTSIPKKIHYVWVGDSPKSDFALKCIESWKKFLPEFEIIEWNNEAFSTMNNRYAAEAFNHKKWAFVSDYIRLYALYNEGGIYLDTDVEITHSFEKFMDLDFFTCHEIHNKSCLPVTSAVIGAKKGSPIIKDLLDLYQDLTFENEIGLDLTPNTIRITQYFKQEFNVAPPYNQLDLIKLTYNAIIYPAYYFCAPEIGKENFAIHHFLGSWLPAYARRDKLSIFNKIMLTRFTKRRDSKDYNLAENEKIVFKIKICSKKEYAVILRN